jgi:hypothetical protein
MIQTGVTQAGRDWFLKEFLGGSRPAIASVPPNNNREDCALPVAKAIFRFRINPSFRRFIQRSVAGADCLPKRFFCIVSESETVMWIMSERKKIR